MKASRLIPPRSTAYGERATDVFYVSHGQAKLEDADVIERVEKGLMAVLSESETAADEKAAQRGIARARASVLR